MRGGGGGGSERGVDDRASDGAGLCLLVPGVLAVATAGAAAVVVAAAAALALPATDEADSSLATNASGVGGSPDGKKTSE